ncbi:FAD dependent oxidoreductase domain-containing protein [Trichoderma longibrachiatum]
MSNHSCYSFHQGVKMAAQRLYGPTSCFYNLYFRLIFILIFTMLPHVSDSAPLRPDGGKRADCSQSDSATYDILIYGSTPAALAAAIQTTRMNKSVAIVSPTNHIGGMTVSGLGWTDSKNGNAIGGIAREFYSRVYHYYQSDSAWTRETRAQYINKNIAAQPGPAIDESQQVQWTFEPHVAEWIFEDWMKELKIPIFRNESLVPSADSVTIKDNRITSIKTQSGHVYDALMFMDTSYEGDFMAAAQISYSIGREARSDFDETLAGVLIAAEEGYLGMSPYVTPDDPNSGLIKGIDHIVAAGDVEKVNGTADNYRLQAFNYRLSLTQVTDNQVPFSKPDDYDEDVYEILLRYIEAGYHDLFFTKQLMPNLKTDSNSNGGVSTDFLGGNYDPVKKTNYIQESFETRAAIAQNYKTYTQGFFWTLANHPRVPQRFRDSASTWGYAKDEWTSNGNWPYEIYIREARRMQGDYIMKQSDVQSPQTFAQDSIIGLGSYTLDSHEVERVVVDSGIRNEGLVHTPVPQPFPIPFGSIIPRSTDAVNFLNPVTMSSTHVAFAAIRMEPTYMIMGQSAATAAVMAIEQCVNIQDVDRSELSDRLAKDKQVLSL